MTLQEMILKKDELIKEWGEPKYFTYLLEMRKQFLLNMDKEKEVHGLTTATVRNYEKKTLSSSDSGSKSIEQSETQDGCCGCKKGTCG